MKYPLLSILACLFFQSNSQNLIRNHDFSDMNTPCLDRRRASLHLGPPYAGAYHDTNLYVDEMAHWFSAPESGYPSSQNRKAFSYDSFNYQCQYSHIDSTVFVPNNCGWGNYRSFPKPIEGDGFIGLRLLDTIRTQSYFNYSVYSCQPLIVFSHIRQHTLSLPRKFAQTRLKQPLVADSNYTVEFYVVRADYSYYTVGEIGAYLSTDTFKFRDFKLQTITPQAQIIDSVHNDPQTYQKWTHVKGSFEAQGGEQFLTLGHFKDYQVNPIPVWFFPRHDTFAILVLQSLYIPSDYFFDAVYVYLSTDTLYEVMLPADTILCPGDSMLLHANHTNTFKIEATKTFLWSTGSTDSTIVVTQPGTYWVEVAYNNRWRQYDTIHIDFYPEHQTLIPRDTTICAWQEVVLHVPNQAHVQYLWSNGSTDTTTTLMGSGVHYLQSLSPCGLFTDTIRINYHSPYDANLPPDTILCVNQGVVLSATQNPDVRYTWSNGSTTYHAVYYEPGTATLLAETPCGTVQFQTLITSRNCDTPNIWIPNAFTPDGDGTNDFFQFFGVPEPVTLHIFNRWGNLVYFSNNYQNDWDGTYSGQPLPGDVYTYLVEYKYINPNANQQDPKGSDRQIRGTVQIVR